MRILHVIGAMDQGGVETFIMNVYRRIDTSLLEGFYVRAYQDATT